MPKILYIQYYSPAAFPPLEQSSRLLANAGWQVMFLGIGATGGADRLQFPAHPNIKVRQLHSCQPGLRQKLHYLGFALWTLGWTFRWRPNWVYVSDLFAAPAAVLSSFLPGLHFIYHEHDSPTVGAPASAFMRFCLAARKWLAKRSELCILPNQERAKQFTAQTLQENVLCVWNCPGREEAGLPRETAKNDSLWVLYHGSIVPPRLPTTVLEAMTMLPETVKLRVIGYETTGHQGYVQQLRELADRLGLEGRVEFLGALSTRAELLSWGRRTNVGLAFMPVQSDDINMRYMTGASNKPFDYLACGNALLVSDLPEWRQMFVEPGYGLTCDSDCAQSIAAALRWFLEHPDQVRRMGDNGRNRIISEWNYERQFGPVLRQLSNTPCLFAVAPERFNT